MKTIITLTLIALLNTTSFAIANNEGVDPTKKMYTKWNKSYVKYPSIPELEKEAGIVMVSFQVTEYGIAENYRIESGISEVLNKEAIEMVKEMPKGHLYENGFVEGTSFMVPIKFILN